MQALNVLARRLVEGCPQMHAMRLRVLLVATAALMQHPRLSISALGRVLPSRAKPKHSIKRIDRLIGNRHLSQERPALYRTLAHWLLQGVEEPRIAVDWSDLSADRQWQLLRAALTLNGRTLTLYEEVHPLKKLGNRKVQAQFLKQLKTLLPPCRPIIVTDAGFQTPWFQAVEKLGWSWLGRLNGREYVRWRSESEWWQGRLIYALALSTPKALGEVEVVRSRPTRCLLFLLHKPRQGRIKRTRAGTRSRSKHSQKNAHRERAPWLLAASMSLSAHSAERIVSLYARRMQIEQSFRDLKSPQYGLALGQTQSRQRERLLNLLLLAALALVLLWLIGALVEQRGLSFEYQSNSRRRRSLSRIHLGRYALAHAPPITARDLQQAGAALKAAAAEG